MDIQLPHAKTLFGRYKKSISKIKFILNHFFTIKNLDLSTDPQSILTKRDSNFDREVKIYEEMIITESNQNLDILTWWKQHEVQLPLLSSLARTHLCTPASVSSPLFCFESQKRKSCEEMTKLLYINVNLPRVEIQDWILEEETKDLIEDASVGELVIGI